MLAVGTLVTVTTQKDLYTAVATLSEHRHLKPTSKIISMRHGQTDFICAVLPLVS